MKNYFTDQLHKHKMFMEEAIKMAKLGLEEGGIPIGSVLVYEDKIIGRGRNQRIQKGSVILHAEMDCLENAGRLYSEVHKNCVLYSTLSPCSMCSGAILLCKIPLVVIGENETFQGVLDRGMINLDLEECKTMLQDFVKKNPYIWNEDIGK